MALKLIAFCLLYSLVSAQNENPCMEGEPLNAGKGYCIYWKVSPCPEGYFCHVGASAKTTVCCMKPKTAQTACEMKLAFGEGTTELVRWFYNPDAKQCGTFVYRGTKGNQNNFITRHACETSCIKKCPGGLSPMPTFAGCSKDSDCPVESICQSSTCCPMISSALQNAANAASPCKDGLAPVGDCMDGNFCGGKFVCENGKCCGNPAAAAGGNPNDN